MARFYGTIQGARGPTSRLGNARSGLSVTAQSYSGDIVVDFTAPDPESSTDWVCIFACNHYNNTGVLLYNGPIRDLLDKDGRKAMIHAFAEEALKERSDEHDLCPSCGGPLNSDAICPKATCS